MAGLGILARNLPFEMLLAQKKPAIAGFSVFTGLD